MNTPTPIDEIEIWNEGRQELTCKASDGKKYIITIKKVGMGQMPQVHKADQGLLLLVEEALLYIEKIAYSEDARPVPKSEDWFNSLEPESQFALVEKGAAIQRPLLQRWIALQESKQEKRLANLEAEAQRADRENKAHKTIQGFDKAEILKEVLSGEARQAFADFVRDEYAKTALLQSDNTQPASAES